VIEATESCNNDFVECRVNDNGAGIPEELLEKVFDKGQVDPESEGGMGLGLAIVKTFTEAHGGQVTVDSKKGVGSTFRFSLPTKARASGFPGR
jgi:signal transduction histidine kinase